jgi:hypothetical protein
VEELLAWSASGGGGGCGGVLPPRVSGFGGWNARVSKCVK